jgi:hypothetical protein
VVRKFERKDQGMNTTFEFSRPYKFKRHDDWPVDIGIAAGSVLGFVLTWTGLVCILYLEHWMAGILGAFAGLLTGWIWFCLVIKNGSKSNSVG